MHFALPQRKSSARTPSAYAAKPQSFQVRKTQRSFIIIVTIGAFALLYLLYNLVHISPLSGLAAVALARGTQVVLVTCFRDPEDSALKEGIIANREDYAKRHGYQTFFTSSSNYSIQSGPTSWAKIPATRHAMTLFPSATYYFYLDPHVLITNPSLSVDAHIMASSRLESLMVTDVPIVPPDSVIKTFPGLKGNRIDFVLTQDRDGLSEKAWIVRRGEWAKYFLDAWYDPLYRSYNFQRAERHALEHIVQWHGTILAKLALVPQNIMNSYHESSAKQAQDKGVWKEGDFVLDFGDCADQPCETLMKPYFKADSAS